MTIVMLIFTVLIGGFIIIRDVLGALFKLFILAIPFLFFAWMVLLVIFALLN